MFNAQVNVDCGFVTLTGEQMQNVWGAGENGNIILSTKAPAYPQLQSLEDPVLCFITAPVLAVDPRYRLKLSDEDREAADLASVRRPRIGKDVWALAVVSIRETGPTVNLLAPLVINLRSLRADASVTAAGEKQKQLLDLGRPTMKVFRADAGSGIDSGSPETGIDSASGAEPESIPVLLASDGPAEGGRLMPVSPTLPAKSPRGVTESRDSVTASGPGEARIADVQCILDRLKGMRNPTNTRETKRFLPRSQNRPTRQPRLGLRRPPAADRRPD